MSAITWTTIKDAIHAWFVAGSTLAPARVYYTGQALNRPDGTAACIAIRIREENAIGQDWTDYEVNPTPSAGAELVSKTRGQRRLVLEATCFPETPVDGVVADDRTAGAILSEVKAIATTPPRRRALRAGGVSFGNAGVVAPLDGVVGSSRFEPRAIYTVTLFVKSELAGTETIIETVNVTPTVDGEELETITVDLTPE